MKRILIIIVFMVVSQLFYTCSTMPKEQLGNISIQKQQKSFKEIYIFINEIINNNNNIDSVIFKSQYYDKNYSIIKFMKYRFSDYFKGLSENGYEIDEIDFFNVNQLEKFKLGDDTERYPEYESNEFKEISHIFNVYVIKKGMIRHFTKNNGALIFTFCLKKDGSWYLRLVDFEYTML